MRIEAVGVCILAGGLSRRMGREKAKIRLGSRTLLQHVKQSAAALSVPVRIIRRDRIPRCGPLGGIYTGLITSKAEAELFLACDMPFITRSLLGRIVAKYRERRRPIFARARKVPGFPCIIPSNCSAEVRKSIEKGALSVQSLARSLRSGYLDEAAGSLMNLNTPDELRRARLKVRKRPKSQSNSL